MSTSTLIRNGLLVLPDGERQGDVLLAGEKVQAIGAGLAAEGADSVIDASGCVVLPGLIDPHTHIVLDTGIYKTPDDWEVGTRTAACGGVTTVIDFATQFPGQDVREALAAREREIGGLAQIDYGLHMMLTQLPEDDAVLDRWMADLLDMGINAAKVYTTYKPNYFQPDDALLRVFKAAAARQYRRDDPLRERHDRGGGARRAGEGGADEPGVPRAGAARAGRGRGGEPGALPGPGREQPHHLRRPLLGQRNGDRGHAGRGAGPARIAETTVQYLTIDETVYTGPHPEWGIMQPPLRAPEEKEKLWAQIVAGEIATIGTDHCDYTIEQKREHTEFTKTPGGIPGLETMLPVLATQGVAAGRIGWSRLAELTSANPRAHFRIDEQGRAARGRRMRTWWSMTRGWRARSRPHGCTTWRDTPLTRG